MGPTPGTRYCYNMGTAEAPVHDCKCDMTMAECKPFPEYIWTATCVPFCENPHGGTGPEGCYDIDEHKCECGTTEDQCKDKPKYGEKWFWTPGCSSCAGKSSGSAEFYIE